MTETHLTPTTRRIVWALEIDERISLLRLTACAATTFDAAFAWHTTLREIARLADRAADDAIDRAETINRKQE